MANINLLFTCPHGGKKDGTTDSPPLQPPLIERDPGHFKDVKPTIENIIIIIIGNNPGVLHKGSNPSPFVLWYPTIVYLDLSNFETDIRSYLV